MEREEAGGTEGAILKYTFEPLQDPKEASFQEALEAFPPVPTWPTWSA